MGILKFLINTDLTIEMHKIIINYIIIITITRLVINKLNFDIVE
jgi:hypothetical protein